MLQSAECGAAIVSVFPLSPVWDTNVTSRVALLYLARLLQWRQLERTCSVLNVSLKCLVASNWITANVPCPRARIAKVGNLVLSVATRKI